MNFVPTPGRAVRAVLGALALQTLCLPWTSALAAQPPEQVTVINGPASPVPVAGTLNVNPGPQVSNPYQISRAVGDSSTCAPQCSFIFPAVPNGKRLVITNVSSQIGSNQDALVIESNALSLNAITFFVPKAYPTALYLSAPVTFYFEAGSTPSARIFVRDSAVRETLIVTFVGFLVPAQ